MPRYMRVLAENGKFQMIEQPIPDEIEDVTLTQPITPSVAVQAGFKRYSCTACSPPRPFGGLGVLSMHFAKAHKELIEDKDSWRKYVSEFGKTGVYP
jgi:hypothetical protein